MPVGEVVSHCLARTYCHTRLPSKTAWKARREKKKKRRKQKFGTAAQEPVGQADIVVMVGTGLMILTLHPKEGFKEELRSRAELSS